MNMKHKQKSQRPELLAPAGNMDCLIAAVTMGANAVYLSGKAFGARSFADNFDNQQLIEAVRYCHLRNVHVHVTVNTMVFDKELEALKEYLLFLDEINVDALIIQDLGVLRIAKELGIRPKLHASTQMTIHNLSGAKIAKELGFDRVVLSRELTHEQVKYISGNARIETEIFVHGAMCMSYSGQCLMSSVLGGRSGNRGKCAQPCRQAYRNSLGGQEKFCLSLKDMSLINNISGVIDSGASSLKIEGRMKGSAYVGAVVKTYADCLKDNRKPTKSEVERLNAIFYRGGQTSGYFDDKIGKNMFTFDKPDNPYKNGSESIAKEVLDEIALRKDEFKIKLNAKVVVEPYKNASIEVIGLGDSVFVCGDNILEEASLRPITQDRIIRQIQKTGGSIFEFDDIQVEIIGSPFVSAKELNELRRKAISELESILLNNPRNDVEKNIMIKKQTNLPKTINKENIEKGIDISVSNFEQYKAVLEFESKNNIRFQYISVPIYLIIKDTEMFLSDYGRIIAETPVITKDDNNLSRYTNDLGTIKSLNIDKLRVNNISDFDKQDDFTLFGSWRLNIANTESALESGRYLSAVMPSMELSIPQIRDIIKNLPDTVIEVAAYGYAPLMITENCITKNLDVCQNDCLEKQTIHNMYDRFNKTFYIMRDADSCRSVVVNTRATYMADKLKDLEKIKVDLINIRFTIESKTEVQRVCGAYAKLNDYVPDEFTRMHFYKGIE